MDPDCSLSCMLRVGPARLAPARPLAIGAAVRLRDRCMWSRDRRAHVAPSEFLARDLTPQFEREPLAGCILPALVSDLWMLQLFVFVELLESNPYIDSLVATIRHYGAIRLWCMCGSEVIERSALPESSSQTVLDEGGQRHALLAGDGSCRGVQLPVEPQVGPDAPLSRGPLRHAGTTCKCEGPPAARRCPAAWLRARSRGTVPSNPLPCLAGLAPSGPLWRTPVATGVRRSRCSGSPRLYSPQAPAVHPRPLLHEV